ncbi:deoxyribose-phosphate aldolase [Ulvibacter antarcticus]|uniref:Deoxyribose-phosphate aldolase n=1 Tax=Ulvibacter antarcticus TaxID=442714 RepID=A0A3L9YDM9_9FLAO|nr:deoxyribose-phosphate aldolase [Ulvibacter antarcticus]RMA58761.1 deoxyribose-phosphate aldolase [Ulvibacter antarcticus]
MTNLHTYIEQTLLKPTASVDDILALCDEAKRYNFYGVCVNSSYVYLAANELKDHPIKVISTVGFPLGACSTETKIKEAKLAVKHGADEIDMVINIGFLKSSLTKSVIEEIRVVKKAINRRVLKVIIETCYLDEAEIKQVCEMVRLGGADYVKTSTGFGSKGAILKDVELMRSVVKDKIGIKASGGIKTASQAIAFINAGATRIGTSNGVAIVYDPKNHSV